MKKALVIIALSVVAIGSSGYAFANDVEFCQMMAKITMAIAEKHQQGVPKAVILSAASDMDIETQHTVREIADIVWDTNPIYSHPAQQAMAVREAGNSMWRGCIYRSRSVQR